MRKSLNNKLFMWLAFLVLIVILFIWALNTTILETFYIETKKEDLSRLFSEINKIYSQYDYNSNSNSIEEELRKIDSKKNIDIVVQNGGEITIYSTSKDFSQNKFLSSKLDISLYLNSDYIKKLFNGEQKYFTDVIRDSNLNSDFVFLFGKLDNNFKIFIRTPVESIKESVAITNRFLIIIGAIALIISAFLALIISNTFTKPIKELNIISQKMSKLDFSQKYEVKSNDESACSGQV